MAGHESLTYLSHSKEVWEANSETATRGSRVRRQLCQLQSSQKGVYPPAPISPPLPPPSELSHHKQGYSHAEPWKRLDERDYRSRENCANTVPLTRCQKQLIKKLSATPTLSAQHDPHRSTTPLDSQAALQANKATFFFQLVSLFVATPPP